MELKPLLSVEKAIFQTLAYADVFDYPLRVAEIWRFLISKKAFSFDQVVWGLGRLVERGQLVKRGKFYCLPKREAIIGLRKKRRGWSRRKWKIALRLGKWLKLIPTVRMAAVTGGLAMNNTPENDDIDFLIVAAKGRLWLTRILVILLVELVARRRRPGDWQVEDKICLNLFLDEAHLRLLPKEHNLYTAHEVVQLRPLWDRDGVYWRFWRQNRWIARYLPNALPVEGVRRGRKQKTFSGRCGWLNGLERLVFKWQKAYMRSRQTVEVVEAGRIFFHPHNCQEKILSQYQERIRTVLAKKAG